MHETEFILPQLVARRASETPDAHFLQEVDGRTVTYAEAHAEALRWAQGMADLGIGRGQTVAAILGTNAHHVAVLTGLAWLGAYEVPVNPAFKGRMLEHVVNDSLATVVIVESRFLGPLAEIVDRLPALQTVVVIGEAAAADGLGLPVLAAADALPAVATRTFDEPRLRDIAVILYTSGTTGRSKGVMATWRQSYETARASLPVDEMSGADRLLCPLPLYHVGGRNFVYVAAILGTCCVLREVFSTSTFWEDIEEYRCTTTVLMGSMARFLLNQPQRPDDAETVLRNVLMSPIIPEVEAFKERFGVRVTTAFNMTEICCPITLGGFEYWDVRSCGRARPGFDCRLVDADDEEVGPDELGELVIRADRPWTMMAGYWNQPKATAAAWRNQWFHTGDVFTKDADGNFFFVDRLKDAIRRKGENISSMEVEAEVNEHPDVAESAAVGVASESGDEEVKLVLVLQPGAALTPAALIDFLAQRMPRYMVPRYVEIVAELPKTPTHKIRKVELREHGLTAQTWDREAAGIVLPR